MYFSASSDPGKMAASDSKDYKTSVLTTIITAMLGRRAHRVSRYTVRSWMLHHVKLCEVVTTEGRLSMDHQGGIIADNCSDICGSKRSDWANGSG